MSREGFGYEEEGAGTLSAEGGAGGAGKQRGRELRHHIKAPSWLQEALTGRVLSGGGRGPLCYVEIKIGRGWGGAPTMERPL